MKEFTQERKKNISQALLNRYYGKDSGITKRFWNTRFFYTFNNLQRRCNSPRNNRYYCYGGRGIKCEWVNFKQFFEDMYPSYLDHCEKFGVDNTQIDRINNDGNYCKENCRWATRIEQIRGQSGTILVDFNGFKISLREWSMSNGFNYKNVFYKYKYKKQTTEEIYNYLISKRKI